MTLRQFIKQCGTQELAANKLGLAFSTINRILNGHNQASRKTKIKFAEHGVKI